MIIIPKYEEDVLPREKQVGPMVSIGLGDMVSYIAKPIASAIDYISGTDIKNCRKCEKRRKSLNEWSKKMFNK